MFYFSFFYLLFKSLSLTVFVKITDNLLLGSRDLSFILFLLFERTRLTTSSKHSSYIYYSSLKRSTCQCKCFEVLQGHSSARITQEDIVSLACVSIYLSNICIDCSGFRVVRVKFSLDNNTKFVLV